MIVTDINNCTAFDTVIVEAGPCAILTGTVTDATCHEACDGNIDIAPGFDSYSWSNGSSSGDLNSLCAGVYTVTATLGDSCSVVATFVVGEPAHLVANTGSTSESAAGGDGTAWVIPSGGTQPYAYLWSTGSTDSLITSLVSDTYSVTLTDANGCVDSAEVFVNEFSCFVIDQNEVQHVFCHDSCDGLIFVVPIGGVGPYEYAWSTKDTSNIVFDLCAGWYSVTITDLGQNGCSNFVDIEILEPDSFYYTVEEIVHLTDSTEASIDVTFHGGTQPYFPLWLGPDLFVSFDEDISSLQPGTYILSLFDSHDCSIIDSIEVLDLTTSLPVLPAGQVDIYPNPASDKIVIDYQSTDNYIVELYSPLGVKTGAWENANQIDVRHFSPGLYVVMFKNEKGYFVKRIVVE